MCGYINWFCVGSVPCAAVVGVGDLAVGMSCAVVVVVSEDMRMPTRRMSLFRYFRGCV